MPQDTALHKAANQGDMNQVKDIMAAGEIDVNTPGAAERTALHRAVGSNHRDIAEFLIAEGANVTQCDKAGRSPLHWAAIGGHGDCLQLLLDNKLGLNGQTKSGMTALHGAVDGNKIECVKVLLQHDKAIEEGKVEGERMNYELKDSAGKTILDLVKDTKNKAVFAVLKEFQVPGSNESGVCLIM